MQVSKIEITECNPCNKPTAQLDLLHSNNPTVLALLVQSLNITIVNFNGKSRSLKKQLSRPHYLINCGELPLSEEVNLFIPGMLIAFH